jgi:hypothetical protein
MSAPQKSGLSDEKAARMMAALREDRTVRSFGVKVPPSLAIKVGVTAHDSIVRGLDQAKEQGDCKEHPESVKALSDFRPHPSLQADETPLPL